MTKNKTKLIALGTLKGCGMPYDNMHESSCRVYSTDGISPTVTTMSGGNLEPKVLVNRGERMSKTKRVGNTNPSGRGMNSEVFDSDDIASTLTTNKGEGMKILQRARGKNDGWVHDISPTVTSNCFQENNFVISNEVICLNSKDENWEQPSQHNRVYSTDGIMTTISAQMGGRFNIVETPCIVASRGRNPDNPSDRTAGTPKEQRLEVNEHGTSNTITSVAKDNLVLKSTIIDDRQERGTVDIREYLETSPTIASRDYKSPLKVKEATKKGYSECELGRVADLSYPSSNTRGGRVQGGGTIFPTITAETSGICKVENIFRIRKLTPKECFRLMDFEDEDYYKCKAIGVSDSQIYKQAGNSIVVSCLEGIFYNLFLSEDRFEKHIENEQISLF